MLSIRLSRTGKRNQPSYRLIVSEKSKDPWGKYLEILGYYNPKEGAEIKNLKDDRLKYWLSKGAELSDTAHNLLVNQGVIDAPKVRVVKIKKSKIKTEEKEDESKTKEGVKEESKTEEAPPA